MSNCRQWNSDCMCVCVTFEMIEVQAIHHFIVIEYNTHHQTGVHLSLLCFLASSFSFWFAVLHAKGKTHLKMSMLWSFTHPHVIPNRFDSLLWNTKEDYWHKLSKNMQFGAVARNSYSCYVNQWYLYNSTTESLHKMHINISCHSLSPNIMS